MTEFETILQRLVVDGMARFDEFGYLCDDTDRRGHWWYLDDGMAVCGVAHPGLAPQLSLHGPKSLNTLKNCYLCCIYGDCVGCSLY